jgi:signal recognition particle subunit SEC65
MRKIFLANRPQCGHITRMKVTAYHRTNGSHTTLWAGSFFSDEPIEESYGSRLVTVEIEVSRPAGDKEVRDAARELGIFKRGLKAYEYLSPRLMDAHVSDREVEEMIELLKERGFDCARVTDYDCPKSWVTFEEISLPNASDEARQ